MGGARKEGGARGDQRRGPKGGVRIIDGRSQWVGGAKTAAEHRVTTGGAGEGPKGRSGRGQDDRWAGSEDRAGGLE